MITISNIINKLLVLSKKVNCYLKRSHVLYSRYGHAASYKSGQPAPGSFALFLNAPFYGNLSKLYVVSINISYRICIDFIIEEDKIIPIDIGTHYEVYLKQRSFLRTTKHSRCVPCLSFGDNKAFVKTKVFKFEEIA